MGALKTLRRVGVWVATAAGLLALTASGATAARPTCLVVGGGGSYRTLQAAVDAASAGATLKVKGTCYGDTLLLKNLTIVGQSDPGFGPATLNGANSAANTGSVVLVYQSATTISGLTIVGGFSREGGGIQNLRGSLTLTNSTVRGNRAEWAGGGILNAEASATISNSTVSANTAEGNTAAKYGGGIYNSGSLTLNNSTVTGNKSGQRGGGIFNGGGSFPSVTLNNSTVTANTTTSWGGGIYNGGGSHGSVTLNSSTLTGNKAEWGGGIYTSSSPTDVGSASVRRTLEAGDSVTLNNSTVSGNAAGSKGGGIDNSGSPLVLSSSTVTANKAGSEGGGILNTTSSLGVEGSAALTNSTVTANTASDGGGISNYGGALALNGSASVSENTAYEHGGGIYNNATGGATITHGSGWTGTVSGNTPDDIFNF
jgi:predicted outer membrane repeat protein